MKTNPARPLPILPLSAWWARLQSLLNDLYRLYERRPADGAARSDSVSLAAREVVRLGKTTEVRRIHVRQGTVWLTRTPADGDILLQAGEQLELQHGWPIVVQALQESRLDWWR